MTKGRPRTNYRKPSEGIQRLTKIIELLRKQDYTPSELIKKTGYSSRTMYRDIQDLKSLKVATLENDKIKWFENKITLSSRDYEIAVKHSKHLLFTDPKSTLCKDQRLDYYSPYMKLSLLVSEERIDPSDVYVLQHFRTGYPELMAKAKAYIELSSKTEKTDKDQKNKDEIREQLVGKIDFILHSVSNGTHLLGVCDCCPKSKITIKD